MRARTGSPAGTVVAAVLAAGGAGSAAAGAVGAAGTWRAVLRIGEPHAATSGNSNASANRTCERRTIGRSAIPAVLGDEHGGIVSRPPTRGLWLIRARRRERGDEPSFG